MHVESPSSYTLIFLSPLTTGRSQLLELTSFSPQFAIMVVFQRDRSVFDMSCSLSVLILSHTSSELLGPDWESPGRRLPRSLRGLPTTEMEVFWCVNVCSFVQWEFTEHPRVRVKEMMAAMKTLTVTAERNLPGQAWVIVTWKASQSNRSGSSRVI